MYKGRLLIEQAHTFGQTFLKGSPVYLREGLIRTYPIEQVVNVLAKVFNLSTNSDDIESIVEGESEYDGFIRAGRGYNNCMQICTVIPNNKSNLERLGGYLNKYGYFYGGSIRTIRETNGAWIQVWWEKKYDEDATDIVHEVGRIYHLCSENAYKRIARQGLTPRISQWKEFQNPERVYFFLERPNEGDLEYYAANFNNEKKVKSRKYYLLEIDISKVSEDMKFYYDSRLAYAVYSLEGIPPAAITVIDEVNADEDDI